MLRISIDLTVQDGHLIPLLRVSIGPTVQDTHWIPFFRISIDSTVQDPILPFVTPYSHTLEMSLNVKLTQPHRLKGDEEGLEY